MASPKKKSPYSISLTIGGKEYKSSGATPTEALQALPKPTKLLLKGIVSISDGKKSKQLLLQPAKLKSLFITSESLMPVKAKQLFMALK